MFFQSLIKKVKQALRPVAPNRSLVYYVPVLDKVEIVNEDCSLYEAVMGDDIIVLGYL